MFVKAVFRNTQRGKVYWYQKLIAWWTKPGPYCHVEFWFQGDSHSALTFSSMEGTGTRFVHQDLSGFDVVTLTEDEEKAKKLFDWCASMQHKSYDWWGIVGFTGPIKVHDDKDRFCSEVVFEGAEVNGLITSKDQRWKVSPNELSLIFASNFGPLQPVK